jgi:hypothetical protein
MTVDILPDVALLAIFEFYLHKERMEAWQMLVHVCRKWRIIVFGSPRRLGLRLYCDAKTPAREMLDVWPPLPIVIWGYGDEMWGVDSIRLIAILEHSDRINKIDLYDFPTSQLDKVMAAMQRPFPELTHLFLQSRDETPPLDPDSFLGGSAPCLRYLWLQYIPFPGLPKLLLSATHLVHLVLWQIPDSGYISPEAMVTALSALTSLETFKMQHLEFESPRSRLPPPPIRTLLPVLTQLQFEGAVEYLEDLVARLDAPLLNKLEITFCLEILDTPHLTQFIGRTPKFKTHNQARVVVHYLSSRVWVTLPQTFDGKLRLGSPMVHSNWHLSRLMQAFPRALLLAVEHLYTLEGDSGWYVQGDFEISRWVELLRPFTAVKGLYICQNLAAHIAPTLKELGERVTEVLPALKTLFLEGSLPSGPVQEAIDQFVAARQLAGHPIAVSYWDYEDVQDEF